MNTLLKYFLVSIFTLSTYSSSKECYDNQEENYIVRHETKPRFNSGSCSVTPFFSPNNSLDAYLMMINEANESISMASPTFTSWNKTCTKYREDCSRDKCYGCPVHFYRHESCPLFSALLNAMHTKGIKVRILTNYYNVSVCPGKVSALHWLHLNGADVRLYKSTSFLHAKFMMIDGGRKVLLSSVNFSETSFQKNREAGVIVSDCASSDVTDLYSSVFNFDFAAGAPYPINDLSDISSNELDFIKSKDVLMSPIVDTAKGSRLNLQTFTNVDIPLAYVAPDYARTTFIDQLLKVKSKLLVHIYTITDQDICEKLKEVHDKGVNITLLVSSRLVGNFQNRYIKKCYNMLCKENIKIYNTSSQFSFSHQKYWIVDDNTVHLSTGNWALTDFANGTNTFHRSTSVNRNMLIVMNDTHVADYYKNIFEHDRSMGTPRNCPT